MEKPLETKDRCNDKDWKNNKGISIKKGSRNSVHVEPLSTFINFLDQCEVPKSIIDTYVEYHYADGTKTGTGKERMSSYEFKFKNMNKIEIINKYFNKKIIAQKAIERFLLKGTNSLYEIDAICVGEPNDYLWITKNEIKEILENNLNIESTGIHISSLFIQPQTRNLNYNKLYEPKRHCVQIKWYSLFDDIIKYKYEKSNFSTK